jgi:hypothetical protein
MNIRINLSLLLLANLACSEKKPQIDRDCIYLPSRLASWQPLPDEAGRECVYETGMRSRLCCKN